MKNNQSSTGSVSVTIQLPAEIAERIENFRKKLCGIKTNHYICNALHNDQRGNSLIAGIFYTHFYRFHTPLQSVNAPAAGHSVTQRVGVKPFYLHIV